MITIKMRTQPYATGGFYRLPDEDGNASIYVMEGGWYQADGTDADGREYTVFWDILPDWDNDEDESGACDWEHPAAVVCNDPWADVTAQAVLVYGVDTAGDRGSATAGYNGVAAAGHHGSAKAGDFGVAAAGYDGSATSGDRGSATAGCNGSAKAGDFGVAAAWGRVSVGRGGCGLVRGRGVAIRGGLGAVLVIAVEQQDSCDLKEWASVVVDGETVKADTWYRLEGGALVVVDA